jgi:mono/diheme cytochrome c family protein
LNVARRLRCLMGLLTFVLAGCDQMVDQPRQSTYSMNVPSLPSHMVEFEQDRAPPAPALSLQLIERGRERYHIFCAPCHAETGDGGGMIVQRGFPAPPSLHADAVRAMAPRELYQVASNGYGIMYGFSDRVPVEDLWAIVAYVHALQHTQPEAVRQ